MLTHILKMKAAKFNRRHKRLNKYDVNKLKVKLYRYKSKLFALKNVLT